MVSRPTRADGFAAEGVLMQPEQTPRQPEALHPDDFPSQQGEPRPQQSQRRPRGLYAGECGDAIWECAAAEGESVEAEEPSCDTAQPAIPETSVRGRLIDLERRVLREQKDR
jgi:hypothetical protein